MPEIDPDVMTYKLNIFSETKPVKKKKKESFRKAETTGYERKGGKVRGGWIY